jgi:hypothetical protein
LCHNILEKCRGIDKSIIEDDSGELPKTLSVENSFRRGTMTTEKSLVQSMESLYSRMTRLVQQRVADELNSNAKRVEKIPFCQYPTVVRVTIRFAPKEIDLRNGRRFGVTRSRQESFDSLRLMNESIPEKQVLLLRQAVTPLLIFCVNTYGSGESLNVTRLNIALSNFIHTHGVIARSHQNSMTSMLTAVVNSQKVATKQCKEQTTIFAVKSPCCRSQKEQDGKRHKENSHTFKGICENDIDPKTLSELPASIAAEILRDISLMKKNKNVATKYSKRAKTIDDYFGTTSTGSPVSKNR